jgi:transposase-like protein
MDPTKRVGNCCKHSLANRIRTFIASLHIPTTNLIESVFSTVRNRTRKSKGCLNRKTDLTMVFKLITSAKNKWRKLSGTNQLPEVIQGAEFKEGIKQFQNAPRIQLASATLPTV